MVKMSGRIQSCLCMLTALFCLSDRVFAAKADAVLQTIEADACDDRQTGFDTKTMEYRAVDKASLTAVKSSGAIQKYDSSLTPDVLDIVAYRLIDEYLANIKHEITHEELNRVCVHVTADLEISPAEMNALIKEHKKDAASAVMSAETEAPSAAEIAEEIKQKTTFKPQSLSEKKLLYVKNMKFWDNTDTNHYTDLLKEQFSHSDYYYVTDDENLADFVVTPILKKAEVDKVGENNRKMQMVIELRTAATHDGEFAPVNQEQNHFILFAAEKNEQDIADSLIQKLLTRAARDADGKINKFLQKSLEEKEISKK